MAAGGDAGEVGGRRRQKARGQKAKGRSGHVESVYAAFEEGAAAWYLKILSYVSTGLVLVVFGVFMAAWKYLKAKDRWGRLDDID